MTTTALEPVHLDDLEPVRPARSTGLDRVRGLAILAMMVDHLALVAEVVPLRLTVGRLALPLFFLLAGHLATRLTVRHLHLVGFGLALTYLAPWAGEPSILLYLAAGCALLVAARSSSFPLWLLAVVPLTLYANRWQLVPVGYDPAGLLALMALGALLPRQAFAWGDRLPLWLELPGRRPLLFYVGHVLALTLLVAA